jgi:hypothetical protein
VTNPDYRALCFELSEALCGYTLSQYDCLLVASARAALAQPEPAPTDEELMAAARKAVDTYPRVSELPYFLSEDSCEYEPMLLALHAAACWGTPVNNIKGED